MDPKHRRQTSSRNEAAERLTGYALKAATDIADTRLQWDNVRILSPLPLPRRPADAVVH
jgi:hypothetical protein